MKLKIIKKITPRKNHIVGIDEAGRGPVIGPLVVAGVVARESIIKQFIELGVRDSKTLSREKRVLLFDKIVSLSDGVVVVYVDPKTVDRWVQKKGLNILEANAMAKIIKLFGHAEKFIIDTPSSIEKFREYLDRYLDLDKINLVLEQKADKRYPIVSAASIIAKVLRDFEIQKIIDKIGIDFGSGYPSDPKTMRELDRILKQSPEIVRKSWKTTKKIANKTLDEYLGEATQEANDS